ncbi:carboxypeptidase-like regulatory domain-containing protein [uncultured Pontibacter sp.]|uniref:carboxypeptidase-like regulatory domain-containing protein n=1 Tax=uncultured Pontibacter sp. TaxID=453356 RepID=UPI002608A30D|nr:carboxypeptidase-like regulatory domain-containing protein [uncultured Pontibacter sp.]
MKRYNLQLIILTSIAFILVLGAQQQAQAQHVVQLSGLITYEDSLAEAAAGIAVFVPHTSRGTHTTQSGFFSLPVLPGDSVVIAALGYEKQYIRIPDGFKSYSYATTIKLKPSSVALPTVDVMPWATERDLRMAVAKVKLPKQATPEVDMEVVHKKIQRTHYPMDAAANQKHGLQQQNRQMQGRYMVPSDVKLFGIPIR